MTSQTTSCYIHSDDKSLPAVYLPDNKEIFVGRNVDTKITDIQCSRKQIRLYASYADQKVFVQQLGSRASGLNGFKTQQGVKVIAQHGDLIEIIYGKYPYKIEFNPPPKVKLENEKTKRLLSQESDDDDNDSPDFKKAKLDSQTENNKTKLENLLENQDTIDDSINMASTSGLGKEDELTKFTEFGTWETFDNNTLYVYTSPGCQGRSKIAAYDMDKTLIKTSSGLQFPRNCNDWQLLYPQIPKKIKNFYEDGYKIVIFSNQGGLGTGKVSVQDFKIKIEKVVKRIGVPMQVYLAVGQSIYRKPRTGMWEHLVKKGNNGVPVEKKDSFYVGDAAGRPATVSRKKDHSLADRLLALNLSLTFHTPEEHFLGHKVASYKDPAFHPIDVSQNTVLYEPENTNLTSDKQELIIMVGTPGSGKSHFVQTHLKGYFYVNRDTLGSWQKCVEKSDEALAQGKKVVVDNTNPDKSSRRRYIDVAKKHKVPVRCFLMNIDKEHAKHNNMFRQLTDPTHQVITDMIINSHVKHFVPPSVQEGFSEIVKINFVPSFKSEEDKTLYHMYLLG